MIAGRCQGREGERTERAAHFLTIDAVAVQGVVFLLLDAKHHVALVHIRDHEKKTELAGTDYAGGNPLLLGSNKKLKDSERCSYLTAKDEASNNRFHASIRWLQRADVLAFLDGMYVNGAVQRTADSHVQSHGQCHARNRFVVAVQYLNCLLRISREKWRQKTNIVRQLSNRNIHLKNSLQDAEKGWNIQFLNTSESFSRDPRNANGSFQFEKKKIHEMER